MNNTISLESAIAELSSITGVLCVLSFHSDSLSKAEIADCLPAAIDHLTRIIRDLDQAAEAEDKILLKMLEDKKTA